MKKKTKWWVSLAVVLVLSLCVAGLIGWIGKQHDDPIAFLYVQALESPQVEYMDEGTEVTIYVSSSPREVKQIIADKVGASWGLTEHKNGNYSFRRGSYERVYISAKPLQGGTLPRGARAIVVYFRPKIPF